MLNYTKVYTTFLQENTIHADPIIVFKSGLCYSAQPERLHRFAWASFFMSFPYKLPHKRGALR